MTVAIHLDATDPTPPYEQLRRQIATAIASGVLTVGTRLPTIRQLAGDLGVANGTVMRAYAELEAIGLVKTGRGAGTVVASSSMVTPADRETQIDGLVFALIHRARLLGLSDADIMDAVASRLRGHERHDENLQSTQGILPSAG